MQLINKGKIMDGIVIINKCKNCTSHDVVKKVKKIVNEKVGHTGTLDPNATGVLPLLIGKGTQLSKYMIEHDKTYEAILMLGEKRDTADGEGKIIESQEILPQMLEVKNVKKALSKLIGKQQQIPPMYSAIKVNGKKLYEYARCGENIEVQPRTIEIYNIELIDINTKEKQIKFIVSCSKGTYIRTLCEKIAENLGTIGYMKELKRIKVGKFSIEQAISIEQFKKEPEKNIITIEKFFENKKRIEISSKKLELFLNGVQLTYNLEDGIYKIYENQKFIGTGTIKEKLLKRDIILV